MKPLIFLLAVCLFMLVLTLPRRRIIVVYLVGKEDEDGGLAKDFSDVRSAVSGVADHRRKSAQPASENLSHTHDPERSSDNLKVPTTST